MKFETTTGRFITADNRRNAEKIAREYNMGELKGSIEDTKLRHENVRQGKFAAWNDLAQSTEVVGSIYEAAEAAYNDRDLVVVFYEEGRPEGLNKKEIRMVNKMLKEAE